MTAAERNASGGRASAVARCGRLIDASPLRELVSMEVATVEEGSPGGRGRRGGVDTFAERCGVHRNHVRRIIDQPMPLVRETTLDRIISLGLGDPGLWWRLPGLAAQVQ